MKVITIKIIYLCLSVPEGSVFVCVPFKIRHGRTQTKGTDKHRLE